MKYYLSIAAVLGAVVLAAAPASALTIDDLKAQVQALLAQIASLQAGGSANVGTSIAPAAPARPVWCDTYADVGYGARGVRVLGLQSEMGTGVLGLAPTGYYGNLTRTAWNKWCTPIVGGDRDIHGCIGSAGYSWCASLGSCVRPWETSCPVSSDKLSASPPSGTAPLTVSFTAEGYANSWYENGRMVAIADRGERYIDFGDGSAALHIVCSNPTASTCSYATTHVYQNAGTYTAALFTAGYYGMQNDATYGTRSNVASVTVTVSGATTDPANDPQCKVWYDGCNTCSRSSVGGVGVCTQLACFAHNQPYCKQYFSNTICPAIYQPVCGRPTGCANTCSGTYCRALCRMPDPQTYSSRCQLDAAGASYLYEGACTTNMNKSPVVSGISGPTSLSINQQGTWTVNASDPENGQLTYSIRWGDEVAYPMYANTAVSSPVYSQASTFTHSYASAGTYTVQVTVTDAQGLSAQSSITVVVSGGAVACTMEYAPVCGQPPEPACRYSYPACMVPTPGPTTYGNTCMMQAAGATYLYSGACTGAY